MKKYMIISNYIHSYLTYQTCDRRTNLNIHILFNYINPNTQVKKVSQVAQIIYIKCIKAYHETVK